MVQVVLVEPEGEENVGSATRAMLNMDVEKLVLVNPQCDHLSRAARNYSVHAQDVLEKATVVPALSDAIAGADISVAITRRTGQWRKRDYTLPELGSYLAEYEGRNIALVFGREKNGLTNEEVQACDLVAGIPSSARFPSLNLAQAVMVTLYEIFVSPKRKIEERAPRRDFDAMMNTIMMSLADLGFFKNVPQSRLETYLKKVLMRARLDRYDTVVLRHLFERIHGMAGKLRKNQKEKTKDL